MRTTWCHLNNSSVRLCVWALLLFGLLASVAFRQESVSFQPSTDLVKLLPATEQDKDSASAASAFARNFSNQVVFLVSSPDREQARSTAEQFAVKLSQSQYFDKLLTHIDPDTFKNLYQFYYPHRYHLLNSQARQLSENELGLELTQNVMNQIMSPISLIGPEQLIKDPLLQLSQWLEPLAINNSYVVQDDGMLVVAGEQQYSVLLSGVLKGDSLSMKVQKQVVSFFNQSISNLENSQPDINILSAGMIFHAKAGADSAQQEISTIGVGSLLGIIILFLVAFRTASPLFLCLLSVGTGIFAGYVSTVLFFGEMHAMTLVFGASLTGVSIDYAFHYMAEWLRQGKSWSPLAGLKHIFPGITLGLLTSLLGYLPMLSTPFPGLQQVAVFSSAGLIMAWITVVLTYPVLLKTANRKELGLTWPLPLVDAILNVWRNQLTGRKKHYLMLVLACSVLGMFYLQSNDDIRQLQSRSKTLVEAENAIKAITGSHNDNRFFLIRGKSAEELLQRNELLSVALDKSIAEGQLGGYISITKLIPSLRSQKDSYQKVGFAFKSDLPELWNSLGFPETKQQQAITGYQLAHDQYLKPEKWLNEAPDLLHDQLWLGQFGNDFFAGLILQEVNDSDQLKQLSKLPGVEFIDKTQSTSELFGRYRTLMSWLLVVAYLIISVVLALRYGIKGAIQTITPPVVAVILTLSILSFTGQAINLFHILALIMVLGIGIDYTLFFHEAGEEQRYTLMAITLSAITTILSFGLLALSATQAIEGFGLTVLTGITFCYLLSPYAIRK